MSFVIVVIVDMKVHSRVRKTMGINVVFTLLVTCLSLTNVFGALSQNTYTSVDEVNRMNITQKTKTESPLQNSVSDQECNLPHELTDEIRNYKPIVDAVINASVNGIFKGRTWRTLAKFVDKFGSRIAGSDNLENAIDYMVDLLKKNQLENVHTEPTMVPKWVRGRESCWLVTPRLEKLSILGLGSSIGTPTKGISAKVVVVNSFEELKNLGKQVSFLFYQKHSLCCILIQFNNPVDCYGCRLKGKLWFTTSLTFHTKKR